MNNLFWVFASYTYLIEEWESRIKGKIQNIGKKCENIQRGMGWKRRKYTE